MELEAREDVEADTSDGAFHSRKSELGFCC